MAGLRQSLPVSDKRARIAGSSLVGVFARCTDNVVLVPIETTQETKESLARGLGVETVTLLIAGASVIGSLICANSKGFILTPQASDADVEKLSKYGRVMRLPSKTNAAGNIILTNDSAALVHPGLSERACEVIATTLGVEVAKGTIGGLKTVGMTGVVNDRGLLVHPRVSEEEVAVLEKHFGLPVDVGTVNFGTPLVGSGLLANSHGYVAGVDTTGPEMGRVEDALDYV